MNDHYIEIDNRLITLDSITYVSPIVEKDLEVFFTIEYKSGLNTKVNDVVIGKRILSIVRWCEQEKLFEKQENFLRGEIRKSTCRTISQMQNDLLIAIKEKYSETYNAYMEYYEKSYKEAKQDLINKRELIVTVWRSFLNKHKTIVVV